MEPDTGPTGCAVRISSHGPGDTARLAAELGALLRPVAAEGWVVALEGDLGAGKTFFVRALARGLGLPAEVAVTSPTFTVAQRFDLPSGVELHHVDAYRLAGPAELEAVGWEDACGKGRVTCVEWAGRVAASLPADRLEVRLEPWASAPEAASTGQDRRSIWFIARGPRSTALLAPLLERRP